MKIVDKLLVSSWVILILGHIGHGSLQVLRFRCLSDRPLTNSLSVTVTGFHVPQIRGMPNGIQRPYGKDKID